MARKPRRPLAAEEISALNRLRTICASLPDCEESESFGNPAFRTKGKPFVVLDRYEDEGVVWMMVAPENRERLLGLQGWFPSPYDPRKAALCCRISNAVWTELEPLVRESFAHSRAAATKRGATF